MHPEFMIEKVEDLFDRKFIGAIGRIVACGCAMYGAAVFLQAQGLSNKSLGIVAVIAAVGLWFLTQYLTNRKK
jgi:hypothetical protein